MDKDMKYVALFAGGILFYTIAMPCIDSISCLLQSAINKKVAHMQMDLEVQKATAFISWMRR